MEPVDGVAFGTVVGLGCATVGGIFKCAAAIKTAATIAAVGYGFFATVAAGVSVASVTAYLKTKAENGDVKDYLSNVGDHSKVAVAGMVQFVSQTLFQALVEGVGKGIRDLISDKISGRSGKSVVILSA